jgi:hypothetical protein
VLQLNEYKKHYYLVIFQGTSMLQKSVTACWITDTQLLGAPGKFCEMKKPLFCRGFPLKCIPYFCLVVSGIPHLSSWYILFVAQIWETRDFSNWKRWKHRAAFWKNLQSFETLNWYELVVSQFLFWAWGLIFSTFLVWSALLLQIQWFYEALKWVMANWR